MAKKLSLVTSEQVDAIAREQRRAERQQVVAERKAEDSTSPNVRWDRLGRWGGGILLTTLVVAWAGAKSHDAHLSEKLQRPHAEVVRELETGEIDASDVVTVTAPTSGSAYGMAAHFSQGEGNVLNLSDTMGAQDQDGDNRAEPGQTFIVRRQDVAPKFRVAPTEPLPHQ